MHQINSFNIVNEPNRIRLVSNVNWREVDLNLLVAFQALYLTNSVSLAADRCFISQSAMSHTLQRLRTLFDDPLFFRTGINMEPTKRAHDIAPVIDNLLSLIANDLLIKQAFSAQDFEGVWKIGLTDYAEQLFAPLLYDAIKEKSPKSQIGFYNVNRSNYREMVESDHIDVVIGSIDKLDQRFIAEHLYTEDHLCLFDPTAVPFRSSMNITEFISIEHALVSPDVNFQTQIDKELLKLSHTRRVSVSSRNFLTIRRLLLGRPLICIVPRRFAEMQIYNHSLMALSPPITVPDFDIKLVYLKEVAHDPKSQWLRTIINQKIHGHN